MSIAIVDGSAIEYGGAGAGAFGHAVGQAATVGVIHDEVGPTVRELVDGCTRMTRSESRRHKTRASSEKRRRTSSSWAQFSASPPGTSCGLGDGLGDRLPAAGGEEKCTIQRGSRAAWLGARKILLLLAASVAAVAGPGAGVANAAQAAVVDMTAAPSPVASGDSLTYTISMGNNGGAKVQGVYMTDQINGMTNLVLTSTVGSCSQTANLVRCDAGTLNGGQQWTVTIRGTVTAPGGTVLHNTATLSSTKSSNTFGNSATVDTLVMGGPIPGGAKPDLAMSIVAPLSVPGATGVSYTLTVNNHGAANANDVRVVNTLPAGVTGPVTISTTSLFTCTVAIPIVNCTGGRVNAGANATITISAIAPAVPGSITDTAVVDPEDRIAEESEFNNQAQATTVVGAPPPGGGTLVITKTDAPDPVTPGDLLTYVITVKNTANTRADSVKIVDGTQGLDAASVSATTSKGVCVVSAPTVTCTQINPTLRLEPGEVMTITIQGTVVASAGSQIINTATVTGNIKNLGHTNTATTTTIVKPKWDLTITKSDSPDPVNSADGLVYTFVVGNSGIKPAVGVTVRDVLPAGLLPPKPGGYSFVGTTGGFVCTVDPLNVMLCINGSIAPESTADDRAPRGRPADDGPDLEHGHGGSVQLDPRKRRDEQHRE